jgi:hypothetical protein
MSIYMDYDAEGSRYTIKAQIAECSPEMLPRELVVNALEAGATKVEWYKSDKGLVCLDNGSGIPETHFSQMLKFSAMTGKDRSVTGNKGIGARLTGLKNSPNGVTYASGHCETSIMIGKDGFAQIQEQENGDFISRNQKSLPGTRITLAGGADTKSLGWDMRKDGSIAREMFRRFYSLPKGVKVKIDPGLLSGNQKTEFKTVSQVIRAEKFKQETVTAESGVSVTFVDAREWRRIKVGKVRNEFNVPCVGTHGTISALVYQNEMYCVSHGASDKKDFFNRIGMPELVDDLMIFVHIPESFELGSNSDRTDLWWAEANEERGVSKSGAYVRPKHFLSEITRMRPEWVQEMLDKKKRKFSADAIEREHKRLHSIMRDIFQPVANLVKDESGDKTGGGEDGEVLTFPKKTEIPVDPGPSPQPWNKKKNLVHGKKQRAKILSSIISKLSVQLSDGMDTPCQINYEEKTVKINSDHRFLVHYRGLLQSKFPHVEEAHLIEQFDMEFQLQAYVPVGLAAADALVAHLLEDTGKKQTCWEEWPTGAYHTCAADAYEVVSKRLEKKSA